MLSTTTPPSRALVFGARGQLGHELVAELTSRYPGALIHAPEREQCDVTDSEQLAAAFERAQPEVVLNATAYNAVDRAESERQEALALNALTPGLIARLSAQHGATLMHFSTDYVFGDGHSVPIDESQLPEPLSAYGRSKLLGEQLALQNNPGRALVVRCCGLYSHRRHNFIHTMLRLARQGRALRVVDDQFVSPTWVKPLAGVALDLLAHAGAPSGIYHAVTHGETSWYDYAKAIFEILDLEVDLSPVSQSEWSAEAERPDYSSLDNAMLRQLGLDTLGGWREQLEAFLEQHGEQLWRDQGEQE